MAASATLALKPGVWFRRGRLLIASPDSLGTACPLSGRNSTYRLVQILEAGSNAQTVFVATIRRNELNVSWTAGNKVVTAVAERKPGGLRVGRERNRCFISMRLCA
jgi:hypothetical protein